MSAVRDKIIAQLACASDRRDEQPNIDLAIKLAETGDKAEIDALFEIVQSGTAPQRADAIKAFYELSERRPEVVVHQLDALITLLNTKNNRILWGVMSALAPLAQIAPDQIIPHLNTILDAGDRGSVIAKDKLMMLLAHLNTDERFADQITPLIIQRLRYAAINQTPMYAEITAPTIRQQNWPQFAKTVSDRMADIPQPAKTKRLQKVLDKGPANT